MKTNKQTIKELQDSVSRLRSVNSQLLKTIEQISKIATNHDYNDLISRIEMYEDYKDEVESLYGIVTSPLKDEMIFGMLKTWVLETRAKFKLKKEFDL
jgi:hypothetical protein